MKKRNCLKIVTLCITGVFLLIQPLAAQTWDPSKRLTWNSGGSFFPAIAVDSNDHIHMVWQDNTPGNYDIYYKKSVDGGVTWFNKRLTWVKSWEYEPAIAVDSSNNIHVVWEGYNMMGKEIHYKKSTDGGLNWSGTKRLSWTFEDSHRPVIAADSSNKIHLIWDDFDPGFYELLYRRSIDGGENWESTKRLTWTAGDSAYAAMAIDTNDIIHVVWLDWVSGFSEIYYKRSTNEGLNWSSAKRLTWNPGGSFMPDITVDSGNNVHVVWHDYAPGSPDIYYKKSTDAGVTWGSTKRLTWNPGDSFRPAIAVDAGQKIHIVWHDDSSGNNEIYHKASTDGGLSWTTKRLSWNSSASEMPSLGIDSSKNIYVVWYDFSPGNYEIYYKKGKQ